MTDGKQRCQIIFLLKTFTVFTSLSMSLAWATSEPLSTPDNALSENNIIPARAHRTRLHYSTTQKGNETLVIENTEFSEGSKVSRVTSMWSKTKFPVEIVLLEDFQLPPRLVPGSEPFTIHKSQEFSLRPTTTLVPVANLADSEFVDSLAEHCYEDEITAIAKINAENVRHRTVHNSATAQSTSGASRFFALGYVVCVKSEENND